MVSTYGGARLVVLEIESLSYFRKMNSSTNVNVLGRWSIMANGHTLFNVCNL
jgi:hypothetical protein